jgi:biotin synthase
LNEGCCPRNCVFCAFAEDNRESRPEWELSPAEAAHQAIEFEADGANAISLMTTAHYPFSKFLEMGGEIRRSLKPDTIMVANTGDLTAAQAQQLAEAGFAGVYHAVRLGEGLDTDMPVQRRLETFDHVHSAGLKLGTCVEPVGPEHSIEELVEKTIVVRDAEPCFGGAVRRISVPGTKLSRAGMVSEARMAHILAVVRLALPVTVAGLATHEPNALGAAAGANLFWAEAGATQRSVYDEGPEQTGLSVSECRTLFGETEWPILDGPSRVLGDAGRRSKKAPATAAAAEGEDG